MHRYSHRFHLAPHLGIAGDFRQSPLKPLSLLFGSWAPVAGEACPAPGRRRQGEEAGGADRERGTWYTVVLGLVLWLASLGSGQAQFLEWATRAGGTDADASQGIAVDGQGNSYVTGFFAGTATFGPGEANQTVLTSAGLSDLFVARYDSEGNLLWATRAGGTNNDQGLGIGIDAQGNSYVTGFFGGTATFGPGEANQTVLTSINSNDLFVAKYDSGGNLLWATQAEGTGNDEGLDIAVDGQGNSSVTGRFAFTATFGPGEANQTVLTSAGSNDIFVAKYDSAGNLLWAQRAGGTNNDQGLGIGVDGSGNSYVTGRFFGTATFGPGQANQTVLTSAGSNDIFVAKYDSGGNLLWVRRAGGTNNDHGLGIGVDGQGNSSVTGFFRDTATFGPGQANQTVLTSAGLSDLFVAQYDSEGNLLWATQAGGTGDDQGLERIAVDGQGNSYVTGFFNGTATFGPGEANETVLISAGASDIVVAKYGADGAGGAVCGNGVLEGAEQCDDGNTTPGDGCSATCQLEPAAGSGGDLVWARRAGGTGNDTGLGIAVDGQGNSSVTGSFRSTATFGPGQANQTVLTSAGQVDLFVAQYDSAGNLLWARRAGGTSEDQGLGIAVDGQGNSYVTGDSSGTATFGPGEANQTVLTTAERDHSFVFVAKYDSAGNLLWATQAGGTSNQGLGIAVDGQGNSYVTGIFHKTATFGPGEANQTVLTTAGSSDLFVAKYDSGGNLLWARRAGGLRFDEGLGIAVDGQGNSYVTGVFAGTATFGPGEANQTVLISASATRDDLFVAKYDSGGNLLWARRAGGTGADAGLGIAADGQGHSFVTGVFIGTATFGPGQVNQTVLTSAGQVDLFVAQYDSGGNLLWARRAGGTGVDASQGIAVDGQGHSSVTGSFSGTATFGSGQANQTVLTSAGQVDLFVAKYDSGGNLLWVRQAGGTREDWGLGIGVDGQSNSYVTGRFDRPATFGPEEANETVLTSAGRFDLFVAKYGAGE